MPTANASPLTSPRTTQEQQWKWVLMDKAALLDQHPMLGRVGRVKGTRELVAHPNYILIPVFAGMTD
ncbi:MAG: hypothetical protein ACOYNF_03525 [Rhodoferax sp.]